MDNRRVLTVKKTTSTAPLVKSRSITSLKSKGDTPSEVSCRTSTVTKKPLTGPTGSSGTPTNVSSKSGTKDIRFRSQSNLNEIHGEHLMEEARLDSIDDAFNSCMSISALKVLSEKSKIKVGGEIDKQISTLQKRVNDNLDALKKTRSKLNTVCLLEEQSNLLAHHNAACSSYAREPACSKGKSFKILMAEFDRIKNQLPCKNVCIPDTSTELADIQSATSQLLHSLELISTTYGADQVPVARAAAELDTIGCSKEAACISMLSTDNALHKASTIILNEALLKTSKLKI